MNEWKLREKLVQFIKTWPILITVFLGSGLIAWGTVHLFPPLQRATADLFIGIDITRVNDVSSLAIYAEAEPFNVDDYKNWQLSQINAIATSERVANLTLDKLRDLDPYWEDISASEFQELQKLNWYDVGKWQLQIEATENKYALQGVQAWREILLQDLSRLIRESKDVLEFEGRMRASNIAISQLEIRVIEMEILTAEVAAVRVELESADSEQGMDDSTRMDLWLLIAGAAEDGALWEQLMDDIPEKNQPYPAYILWIDQVLVAVDSELERHQAIMEELISNHELLTEEYLREIKEAHGLSASLFVGEEITQPRIIETYPDTQIALLGSLVGLLIYIIIWIMFSERQRENS